VLKEELWPAACKKSRAAAKLSRNVLTDADSWFDCFDWVGSIFFTVPNVYMGESYWFKAALFYAALSNINRVLKFIGVKRPMWSFKIQIRFLTLPGILFYRIWVSESHCSGQGQSSISLHCCKAKLV
jgi:hypothetical protein